jgi:hypothetical protein
MTIEERLERLTQRHDALIARIELLTRVLEADRETSRSDGKSLRALLALAESRLSR